ncbi:MAG TPA: DUF2064 domain-containing protein [Amnibacterium sp.]|nr:DUF2064 domain-containing protein [Amnibacterium sp.]
MSTLVVVAKECLPGRVKTRLVPALSPEDAAEVAAASLAATLEAAALVRADRHLLYLDGRPPAGCGFDVLQQPSGTLDVRLAALFETVHGRTLLIGMDTPQVDPAVLAGVLEDASGVDAWFGPATDGGFWALGLDAPAGTLLAGVPMSAPWTGAVQRARLVAAGLRIRDLPRLTDVDTIGTAREVAALLPGTRFACLVAERDAA